MARCSRINSNNKKSFFITTIVAALFFSFPIFAEEEISDIPEPTPAKQIYSWKDCVEIALQNNADLMSALNSEKSMKFAAAGAKSNFLPQLTANSNSGRSFTNNSNPSAANSLYYTTNTVNVAASQNLFSGFQDMAKIAQAKANAAAATANVIAAKAKVSYDLRYAFEYLTYAKEYIKLLDDIIKRREDNLRIVELRFKGGMENKGSFSLAQAYLADAKYSRLQAQNLQNTARAQLCKALGFSQCLEFDIDGSSPVADPQASPEFDVIVKTTPQHIKAVALEDAAKAGIKIAESQFYPTINATALKGDRGTTYLPQNDYWSVGLNISFPFFTGGKDYYARQSAMTDKAAATHNRESTDRQALADLKQYYATYMENVAKLAVSENYRNASQLRAEIARNKYNNGLLTFEDWDVIENDLINRQTTFLQTKRDRVVSEAAWQQIQGIGVYSE